MPCSCGNTSCPCGIPCDCSEESCKCYDCAIALPRCCKICNKQLITERRTDEETCSCFIGESIALVFDNHDNPHCRLGDIPIGYFVPGKLVVNVMIPIPVVGFPHIIPRQPLLFIPPVPSVTDHSKISLISEAGLAKPLYHPPENSPVPTAEPNHFLSKSNETTSDYDLSSYGSNCEQKSEICCKLLPSSEFLQSTDDNQTANVVQNTKSEETNSNFQDITSFYLPSVVINNISYPVGMRNPIWRLPNPVGCIAGSFSSTLNLLNPFYMAGPIPITATYENELSQSAPCPIFEAKDMRCVSENQDGNLQPESSVSLKMDEKTLDTTILLQQSNLMINDENVGIAVSSNNATLDKYTTLPSSENFDASEQCGISANYSMPDQSHSLGGCSTSTSGKNYSLQVPDICNSENRISGNVYSESTGDVWRDRAWCSPLPEIPVLTGSIPLIPTATSKLQQLFNQSSRETNRSSPTDHYNSNSANDNRNKENIPLYIDSHTTQKMERILKQTINGNFN